MGAPRPPLPRPSPPEPPEPGGGAGDPPRAERGSRWGQITLATLAVITAARVALVLSGQLEGSFVADDAYYYFTIARHLAEGLGPTFDGLALTNGFQPLWQLALVPLFAALRGLWAPVRAALLLAIALDLLTAWRIHRLVRARATPRRAALVVLAWCASPLGFLLGLRGMEASLSTLAVVLLLEAVAAGGGQRARWRRPLACGALLGLCGWARTDNLVTAGSAMAAALWFCRRDPAPVRRRVGELAAAASAAAAVMAPWFAWSWVRFGQLVQVSGQVKRANPEIYGALPRGADSLPDAVSTFAHALFAPVLIAVRNLSGQEFTAQHSWVAMASGVLAGGLTLLWLGARRAVGRRGARGPVLAFAGVYVTVHGLLFGLVWRAYADWYAAPTFVLLAVALALLTDDLVAAPRAERRAAAGGLGLLCAALAAVWISHAVQFPYGGRRPEERWGPQLQRIAAAHPHGARLGAWDAGMVGYVATSYPSLTVVNLDGLVNNEAFAAARRGDYADYLLRNVDVLVQDVRRARLYLDREQLERLQELVRRPPP